MDAFELRIGNFVYLSDKDKVWQILDGFEIDKCDENPFSEPIPLTEEWLFRFGFEDWGKQNGDWVYGLYNVIDGTSHFIVNKADETFYPLIDNNLCCWSDFKYVHQLQNLYFALTGNELVLKSAGEKI